MHGLVVGLAVFAHFCHALEPPKPTVPTQFTVTALGIGRASYSDNETLYYDGVNQRSASAVFDGQNIISASFYNETGAYQVMFGVCRSGPGKAKFFDWFAFLNDAIFIGQAESLGRACNAWSFMSLNYNVTGCFFGNTPVQLNTSIWGDIVPGTPSQLSVNDQDWVGFTPGPPTPSRLTPPVQCFQRQPSCPVPPGATKIQSHDHYIAHPANIYNLSDENTADLPGDVYFLCVDVLRGHTSVDKYNVVSRYEITMDVEWGPYALCNGYPGQCWGDAVPDWTRVGRETSFGLNPDHGGQCANSSDQGFWFSLPAKAKCESMDELNAGRCAWFVVNRIKTVNLTCIFDTNGMRDACVKDQGPPYSASKAIFRAAFESEDPDMGGCPHL